MQKKYPYLGVAIGLTIMAAWFALLGFQLQWELNWRNPWAYLAVLVMAHLYTGLFITAHDAMHGVVAPTNKKLNKAIGFVSAILFAFNWYPTLFPKHHEHHRFVATEQDPDFHRGNPNFFAWYYSFGRQYISIWQIVGMAISFNLLKLVFPTENLIMYWIVPSLLATFQLFYFGTYLPHRGEHAPDNRHKSRTLKKNHLWAFLTCYFFGYHYEHHHSPGTPWWLLYREKEKMPS